MVRLFVFVLASICCLLQAKQQLFYNANGYTLTTSGELKQFQCLVIESEKISRVMSSCSPQQFSDTVAYDVKGKTLLPGMIDAHGHVNLLGDFLMQIDLRGISSNQQTIKVVNDYGKNNPDQTWLIGTGWNQVLWQPQTFPTHIDIDQLIDDRPVWLVRVDGHVGWANKKAMDLAGITADTKSPEGGKIVVDDEGKPTGIFIDNAMSLIQQKIPKTTKEHVQQALNVATKHLLSLGITATHDAGINHLEYQVYRTNAQQGKLKLRFYAMISASDPKLGKMLSNGYITDKKGFLSIRSVKVFGDGSLGSRGAAMLDAYSDDPHEHGILVTPEAELPALFYNVLKHKFQLNFHAIGDKANRLALKHYQQAYHFVGGQTLRHRVEHAQVVNIADISQFKKLNLIASMQPTHATSDKNMAQQRIGAERMKGAYAWQSFLKQGVVVAGGSDYPIELANIFHGFHAAVTRQDRQNKPIGGWFAHERLTRKQAFRAFTLDAAYAGHQEKMIGSLEAGKWADFIIVDTDIFQSDETDLWKTQVLETWVAGKRQYSQ